MLAPIARTTDATEKDRIMITAEEFARECGIKTHSAYTQLELASKNLLKEISLITMIRGKKVLL